MNEPKVLFEDEAYLVLEKPSGWVVTDAVTVKIPTIQSWLEKIYSYDLSKSKSRRSGVVHRIDKETSGILLVAKTKKSFVNLQLQFKKRSVQKKYLCLVHGKLKKSEGEIEASVGRLPWNRERFGVHPGGREALSLFKLSKIFRKDNECFSLVEVFPKTGRTHQIRVHMKHIGNPIVSDTFYAGRKTSRKDRLWCPRLFLHACEIEFFHPTSSIRVKYKSDLPSDLKQVLQGMEEVALQV